MLTNCLIVGLGGFVGAVCRYLAGLPFSSTFPVGTLLVNVMGALLIGFFTELSNKVIPLNPRLLLFLTTGVMGGFTTFSTFSLETVNLLEMGRTALGVCYASLSLVLCLAGVIVGKWCARLLVR